MAIASTIGTLRKVSLILGIVGAGFTALFARQISLITFDSEDQTLGIRLLGIAVFMKVVSGGQAALIQGLRKVSEVASLTIFGGLFGTLATLCLVYQYGQAGIVPSILATAAAALLCSWWFSRKVQLPTAAGSFRTFRVESAELLKLGIAFMATAFISLGCAYAVRALVSQRLGLEAAGLYQAAWAIGGLYVGFILQAMGSDFYPRLTAAIDTPVESNRLVNEQAQISLLLAGPGVIATYTIAPVVLTLLYSAEFLAAVDLLRFICGGMALRVISWPLGFIILAKGNRLLLFWTEVAWAVVHILLAVVLLPRMGLNAVGLAFLGSYVFHVLIIYPIVRKLTGFRWSTENIRACFIFIASIAVVWFSLAALGPVVGGIVGASFTIASSLYSLREILKVQEERHLPGWARRILSLVGSARS